MKKNTKVQKIKQIDSHKDASKGEHSPYWDHMASRSNEGGSTLEHPQANPDVLPETEIAAPSTPQLLMGEAVEHLQGRQLEVYFLTMREGKSLAETAEILGIEKGSAQKYKERAIKFISQYCEAAIAKGRV
jgi:DNA-directed RNA polymerase specialized sigma24 family protein